MKALVRTVAEAVSRGSIDPRIPPRFDFRCNATGQVVPFHRPAIVSLSAPIRTALADGKLAYIQNWDKLPDNLSDVQFDEIWQEVNSQLIKEGKRPKVGDTTGWANVERTVLLKFRDRYVSPAATKDAKE